MSTINLQKTRNIEMSNTHDDPEHFLTAHAHAQAAPHTSRVSIWDLGLRNRQSSDRCGEARPVCGLPNSCLPCTIPIRVMYVRARYPLRGRRGWPEGTVVGRWPSDSIDHCVLKFECPDLVGSTGLGSGPNGWVGGKWIQ